MTEEELKGWLINLVNFIVKPIVGPIKEPVLCGIFSCQ